MLTQALASQSNDQKEDVPDKEVKTNDTVTTTVKKSPGRPKKTV